MKIKLRSLCLLLIFLSVASVTSCRLFVPKNNAFYGGQVLDDNMMESIKENVLNTESGDNTEALGNGPVFVRPGEIESPVTDNEPSVEETASEMQEASAEESDTCEYTDLEFDESTVFWTEGGGVWHLFNNCGHLKRSKKIYYGTVEEAVEAGKEKVCSTCAKKAGND